MTDLGLVKWGNPMASRAQSKAEKVRTLTLCGESESSGRVTRGDSGRQGAPAYHLQRPGTEKLQLTIGLRPHHTAVEPWLNGIAIGPSLEGIQANHALEPKAECAHQPRQWGQGPHRVLTAGAKVYIYTLSVSLNSVSRESPGGILL